MSSGRSGRAGIRIEAERNGSQSGRPRSKGEVALTGYREQDLIDRYLATFRHDDFAVFRYPPRRFEKWQGHNATTDLVLDFKESNWDAVAVVTDWATKSIKENVEEFRDRRACRYILAAPKHTANTRNVPSEELCARLAKAFKWLTYLDGALVRTADVAKSAGAASRPTIEEHVASMRFTAPVAVSGHERNGKPYCPPCQKPFRGLTGFEYHNGWAHGGKPAEVVTLDGTILLVDDVITHGGTSTACRQVIADATGCRTVGFFVGKTGGW